MESKPKGFLLKWKLRSLRILCAVIYVFVALFFTFLNVRGYYRNPGNFTVKAIFPAELSLVMEIARPREYMPNGLVTIPGEVSDLVGANIAEAYRVITCFPEKEAGLVFGHENVCALELYVWRGDGLPTLYITDKEPVVFVDLADYGMIIKPGSYNKYYIFEPRSTPEVFGNTVVQTFHKTSTPSFFFFGSLSTLFRLLLAWILYLVTMSYVKEYRSSNRVYDAIYE